MGTKRFALLSCGAVLAASLLAVAVLSDDPIGLAEADDEGYVLRFAAGTNCFPSSVEAENQANATTGLGNAIAFAYRGVLTQEAAWGNLDAGGYIENLTPISGLSLLEVTFGGVLGELTIDYGWWDEVTSSIAYEVTGQLEPWAPTYDFGSEAPSYLRIRNEGGMAVQLMEWRLHYSCMASSDPYITDHELGLSYILHDEEEENEFFELSRYEGTATEVEIPESYEGIPVTSIKRGAFSNATWVTSLTLPDSLLWADEGALAGLSSLTRLSVPYLGAEPQAPVYGMDESVLGWYFGEDSYEGSYPVTQHNAVEEVGTFYLPSSLAIVDVRGGYGIGEGAFSNCDKLISVAFPVTDLFSFIFADAFSGCTGLSAIVFPDTLTTIGARCFMGCTSLTAIEVPDAVLDIGVSCFQGCSSLSDVTLPSSLETLPERCFSYCSALASITIPDSVTSIGDWCFDSCSALAALTLPDAVTSIGDDCFYNCLALDAIAIPEGVTSLGMYCFYCCRELSSVTLPSTLTSLGAYCFYGCPLENGIALPSSITDIGEWCFAVCGFGTIFLPSSVTYVGSNCFYGCPVLTGIHCGATEQPGGWNDYWDYKSGDGDNIERFTVVWGATA